MTTAPATRRYLPRGPGYSRLVVVLKVVLPLAALAALSSVFLLASPVDPERALRSAEIDAEDRARDPRLTGARFVGVTRQGSALRIDTETARSDPEGRLRFQVTGLALQLDDPEGGSLSASAQSGVIDRGAGRFDMAGPVEIDASPGYRLQAETLSGLLDQTLVYSNRPVQGDAPAGRIEAGSMRLTRMPGPQTGPDAAPGPDEVAGNRLVFGGGVRLIYHPQP